MPIARPDSVSFSSDGDDLHGRGHAEIGDDRLAVLEQDVLRLDVAVDHALAVGVVQGERHLARDPQGDGHGELALPLEPAAQRFAAQVRHDVVEQAVGHAGIEQRQDVRMGEPGNDADLAQEPLGLDRGGELRMHHLEGDVAVVPEVVREIHGGGAAPAQEDWAAVGLPLDAIAVGQGCGETFGHRKHARAWK